MWLIFKTQWRNRTSFLLMSMQVAITLAVLINALALVKRSIEIIEEPTGVPALSIIAMRVVPFDQRFNDLSYVQTRLQEDLRLLRDVPGVVNASVTTSFPGDIGDNSTVGNAADEEQPRHDAGVFFGDNNLLDTLGIALESGRNFTPEEIYFSRNPSADQEIPQLIILTSHLAHALFPDESAIGKSVTITGTTRTVIGVTELFRGRSPLLGEARDNVFIPGYSYRPKAAYNFLIRAEPTAVRDLITSLPDRILNPDAGRDVDEIRMLNEILDRGNGLYAYGGIVLMVISGLLALTTALGIFGVTFLSVNRRRKQIGVRRALGATRAMIMKQFMLENLVTTGTGVVIGCLLAVALNIVMTQLGLGRVDFMVTGAGILLVLIVGQFASLLPAWRAANIEPAEATRV